MTRPYVVTISSEKGGVGKTTLATNLAIYFKARDKNIPVTLLSFDNHFSVDRMFGPGRSADGKNVCGLFKGIPLERLVVQGDYGVQFVPSSRDLPALRDLALPKDRLTRTLLNSSLEGVLIIDTRPDLDVFTQNALFASDRVIVPVKDAPSLENCTNLFAFFDQQGLSRKTPCLLPSLIDQRIHYEGPFKNQYQLLRGYAINRGYPCYDLFITKSPKVESLGTNPKGRIYPVLTHGRKTEVHQQMCQLTLRLYDEYAASTDCRLQRAQESFKATEQMEKEAYLKRLRRIGSHCLFCGQELAATTETPLLYGESLDGTVGMVEQQCLIKLQGQPCNDTVNGRASEAGTLSRSNEGGQPIYALRRSEDQPTTLVLFCFNADGKILWQKKADLTPPKGWLGRGSSTEFDYLLHHTLPPVKKSKATPTLVLAHTDQSDPTAILQPEGYTRFRRQLQIISPQLASPHR